MFFLYFRNGEDGISDSCDALINATVNINEDAQTLHGLPLPKTGELNIFLAEISILKCYL